MTRLAKAFLFCFIPMVSLIEYVMYNVFGDGTYEPYSVIVKNNIRIYDL